MKKTMSVMFPTQKRSFLLFELLVSLTLIVLCLFPLIKPHTSIRKEEQAFLYEMQLERLAQEAFCILKEDLYNNKLSWNSLRKGCSGTLDHEFSLTTGAKKIKHVSCNYIIQVIDHCEKKSNKNGLLLAVDLEFQLNDGLQHLYERTLYLEKGQS